MLRRRLLFACAATTAATIVVSASAAINGAAPILRLQTSDQAQAEKVVLHAHDFPSAEWRYHPIVLRGQSIDAICSGQDVDLSHLVITGQTGSRGTRSYGSLSRQDVVTEAFIFATPAQARTIQARLPSAFMHRCIDRAGTTDAHGGHIDSVSRLTLRTPGVGVIAYRVAVTSPRTKTTTYGDYLFLRAHRTWVTIFYDATPLPPAFDSRFVAAIAARIR